jgi:hypothetical protein
MEGRLDTGRLEHGRLSELGGSRKTFIKAVSVPPASFDASGALNTRIGIVPSPPAQQTQRLQQAPGPFGAQASRGSPALVGTTDDPITAWARLQSFNGGFTLDSRLANLLFGSPSATYMLQNSIPVSIKRIEEGKAEGIWATVVACAYLEVKLGSEKEVWEGLREKAKCFVEESFTIYGLSATFDGLNKQARALWGDAKTLRPNSGRSSHPRSGPAVRQRRHVVFSF